MAWSPPKTDSVYTAPWQPPETDTPLSQTQVDAYDSGFVSDTLSGAGSMINQTAAGLADFGQKAYSWGTGNGWGYEGDQWCDLSLIHI